jgi:hypothetical protein
MFDNLSLKLEKAFQTLKAREGSQKSTLPPLLKKSEGVDRRRRKL